MTRRQIKRLRIRWNRTRRRVGKLLFPWSKVHGAYRAAKRQLRIVEKYSGKCLRTCLRAERSS